MSSLNDRLGRERHTMAKMVEIYCNSRHQHPDLALCADCQEFLDYADVRLEKCPYGADKPTCANCPIHCYKPERREQARTIMRYSGPRMLLRHPWLTIVHQLDGFRKVSHPRELTRKQRRQSRQS